MWPETSPSLLPQDAHQEGGRRGGLMAQAKASKEKAEAAKRSGRGKGFRGGSAKVGTKRVLRADDTLFTVRVETFAKSKKSTEGKDKARGGDARREWA